MLSKKLSLTHTSEDEKKRIRELIRLLASLSKSDVKAMNKADGISHCECSSKFRYIFDDLHRFEIGNQVVVKLYNLQVGTIVEKDSHYVHVRLVRNNQTLMFVRKGKMHKDYNFVYYQANKPSYQQKRFFIVGTVL